MISVEAASRFGRHRATCCVMDEWWPAIYRWFRAGTACWQASVARLLRQLLAEGSPKVSSPIITIVRSKPRDLLIGKQRICTTPSSAMDTSSPSSATNVPRPQKVILDRLHRAATTRILDFRSLRRVYLPTDRNRAQARAQIRHCVNLVHRCSGPTVPAQVLVARTPARAGRQAAAIRIGDVFQISVPRADLSGKAL